MDNISKAGSQLQFVLKKQDAKIWWCRLTAQPQKQNWIHVSHQMQSIELLISRYDNRTEIICSFQIHEKTWISRDQTDLDEQTEYRDIRVDYPGIDDVVHKEELGYRKSVFSQLCALVFFFVVVQPTNRFIYFS